MTTAASACIARPGRSSANWAFRPTIFLATACLDTNRPLSFPRQSAATPSSYPGSLGRSLSTAESPRCSPAESWNLAAIATRTPISANSRTHFEADCRASLAVLRDRFGLAEAPFAFPYGYFTAAMSGALEKAGATLASTTSHDLVAPRSNRFAWPIRRREPRYVRLAGGQVGRVVHVAAERLALVAGESRGGPYRMPVELLSPSADEHVVPCGGLPRRAAGLGAVTGIVTNTAVHQGALSVADQAVVSAASFLTGEILADATTKEELGIDHPLFRCRRFAGIQSQLVAMPYMFYCHRYEGDDLAAYSGSVVAHQIGLSAAAAVIPPGLVGALWLGVGPQHLTGDGVV